MNVQKFAPVYRNTVGLIMGETVLVEVMKKFKDVGITDHGLVWNTDLIETLELENHINLAEHVRYSAVTLAERLPGSSETAKISADMDVIKEPVDCRLPLDVDVIKEPVDCRLPHRCQQCTSTLGALLKTRSFPDRWQPVRLTALQTMAPIVLVPTLCLTSRDLAARPRSLRLSW